jgi:hypothetical protein
MAIEWDRSWGKKRGRDGWVGDVLQTLITARRRGWSGDCQVALDFEVSFMNSLDLWSAISCSKRKKLSLVGVIYHHIQCVFLFTWGGIHHYDARCLEQRISHICTAQKDSETPHCRHLGPE